MQYFPHLLRFSWSKERSLLFVYGTIFTDEIIFLIVSKSGASQLFSFSFIKLSFKIQVSSFLQWCCCSEWKSFLIDQFCLCRTYKNLKNVRYISVSHFYVIILKWTKRIQISYFSFLSAICVCKTPCQIFLF